MPKLNIVHNSIKIHRIYSKGNQVIYFSAKKIMPNVKAQGHILFEISCTQRYNSNFQKVHNSTITRPPEKKKNTDQLIFHMQPVYEFSKPLNTCFISKKGNDPT